MAAEGGQGRRVLSQPFVDWAGAGGFGSLEFRAVFPFSLLRTTVLGAACLTMVASCRPLATGPGNREATFADRIQTKTVNRVAVSACLLPDEEARQRYGVSLARKGLQAVWLRVAKRPMKTGC
jgi:hypothetical protein